MQFFIFFYKYLHDLNRKKTVSPVKKTKNQLTFIRLVGTELPKKTSPYLGQVVGQTKSSRMAWEMAWNIRDAMSFDGEEFPKG